jgi:hypothetical protein
MRRGFHDNMSGMARLTLQLVNAVHEEIEQYLRQVHAVADHTRQPRLHSERQIDVFGDRFCLQERHDIVHDVFEIERFHLDRTSFEKLAHSGNDVGAAAAIPVDIAYNRAQLVKIRFFAPQLVQRNFGVKHIGRQWLCQFVRQRGCQLPQCGGAFHLCQLHSQLRYFQPRTSIQRDVTSQFIGHDQQRA